MSIEKPFTVYVVEDNDWYNKLLVHNLSLNPDFIVKSFFSGKKLLNALHEMPDVVTVDYRLPDMTGEELLQKIKNVNENIEVVIISEQEDIKTAVNLLKAGAYDYLVKTKDIRDTLLNTIQHIRKNVGLQKRIARLEEEVVQKYEFEKTILGASAGIKKLFQILQKAVGNNITVSIAGETGTGKEVVAKAIHYNSERKNKPFVAVNVAAIPSELFESELFGHEKGSFTGANTTRIGKFEEASGGTLFLDEIGEMDINFQAKLLRALQEKEVTRIGSNKPIKTDCRIIVASHKNLLEEVKKGNFREDLYYRLFGLPIQLPPLRERDKDVLILSKSFIQGFCKENGMSDKTLNESAQMKLMSYHWPGNIRELKSVIELACVMSNDSEIDATDIVLTSGDALPDVMFEELSLREYNRRIVQLYMEKYDNNTKMVADKLDIGQTTVYRLLKEDKMLKSENAI
ncbi:MAG: sigma-54 dependent transcriptional regulator [Crocinitomicaceae bacterium]|jgi:DNA-binding NtrC family response regulator|nr:sigma-54 dependent transcriptional regulator [Crocinitomicaceae bacterium]